MDRGVMRQRSRSVMRRLAEGVALLLIAGACGGNPVATGSVQPATPLPERSPSPSPTLALPTIVSPASERFLVEPRLALTVAIGTTPTAWDLPGAVILPGGEPAARYALLPVDCPPVGRIELHVVALRSPDPWERTIVADPAVEAGIWPGITDAWCDGGSPASYLEVAFRPLTDGTGSVNIVASDAGGLAPSVASLTLVPVLTSIDAERPAFMETSRLEVTMVAGAGSRASGPLTRWEFTRATLPDGSIPTTWAPALTGCGGRPETASAVTVTVSIGDADPVELGTCIDGGIDSPDNELPLPADGTPIAIFATGGTVSSTLRISEFQWRAASPPD